MNPLKITILKMDKEEVYVHKIDNDLYYIEDSSGLYSMSGKDTDYVEYMTDKGWTIGFEPKENN